jgi:hypothetical protein
MTEQLTADDASQGWVRNAMQERAAGLCDGTVKHLLDLRFGERRVSFDPSDPEANRRDVGAGDQLVYGSQMGQAEWDVARRAGAIQSAGKLMPTPKR